MQQLHLPSTGGRKEQRAGRAAQGTRGEARRPPDRRQGKGREKGSPEEAARRRPRPPRSPGHALTVRLGAHQQRHPLEALHVGGGDVPGAPVVPLPILVQGVDLHPPAGVRHGAAPASGPRSGPGPAPPPGGDGAESGLGSGAAAAQGQRGAFNAPLFMAPRRREGDAAPRLGPPWRRSAASAATAVPPPSCNPTLAAFLFLPARPRAPLAGATAAGSCLGAAAGTAAAGGAGLWRGPPESSRLSGPEPGGSEPVEPSFYVFVAHLMPTVSYTQHVPKARPQGRYPHEVHHRVLKAKTDV